MMLHPRTLILLAVAAVLVGLTLRSLRAQRLKERHVLLFLLTGLPFLVLAFWPDGIVFLSDLLEIEKPTLLVLIVATYFLLTTFELLSIVSVQDRKIATLGQWVGILLQEREARQQQQQQQEQQQSADTSEHATPASLRESQAESNDSPRAPAEPVEPPDPTRHA